MAYNSGFDLDALMVNTKAATLYTAHENSLFLGGDIIPVGQIPAGSTTLQVPLLGSVTATKITAEGVVDDVAANAVTGSAVNIEAAIYAARTVLRDMGGVDPAELGRVLGNSIQKAFDADVAAALASGSITATQEIDITAAVDGLYDAAAQIRGNGETGQLFAIVSPAMAAALMKQVGSSSYAGSDAQNTAMMNGWVGSIAGIRVFQSSYVSANVGTVFSADAFRIGMFKGIDLEAQRRAEAVGNDLVASLHAGVALVDPARAVRLVDLV